jgi:SAM-dependent methyltransferase
MTTTVARVRRVFDEWARSGRAKGMEQGHGPTARQAFDRLGVAPGMRYLDVGCGNGYTVRWAAAVSPDVRAYGIDLSEKMIEQARDATGDVPNITLLSGVFPNASISGTSFDAIFSMEALYYLEDLEEGLTAIAELLVPGGRFACVVDYYEENAASQGWAEDLGLSLHRLSADGWRDAFERAGLTVLEQTRLHPPRAPGQAETWKHTEGSLLTLGERPAAI